MITLLTPMRKRKNQAARGRGGREEKGVSKGNRPGRTNEGVVPFACVLSLWVALAVGAPPNGVAQCSGTGAVDTTFVPAPSATDALFDVAFQGENVIVSRNNTGPGTSRLLADGRLDPSFREAPAARALGVLPDSRIVIGGHFTSTPEFPRSYLAGLHSDGSLDLSFAASGDPDGFVWAIVVRPNGKVIISGWFTQVAGVARNGLAQLNPDGSLDETFDPGSGLTGDDGLTYATAMALQADGKLVVIGDFTHVGGLERFRLARLNPDGTPDPSLDGTADADGAWLESVAIQSDGKILVGGVFDRFQGTTVGRLARLHPNGALDSSFQTGTGIGNEYGSVKALLPLPDGRLVVGGWFWVVDGQTRNSLACLDAKGSLDPTFMAGVEEGGNIRKILQQPDGKLLIAGDFSAVNGVPRMRVARLCMDSELVNLSAFDLFTDATRRTHGLVGSYLNSSLRSFAAQNDWRLTQTVAGWRVDTAIQFTSNGWGSRAALGLAGGTDADWESFSVQWDGYLDVLQPGTRFATRSDDGSRMWIDLNNDGVFAATGPEFINNHWGAGQGATVGSISQPVPMGLYRVRLQYEEGNGANVMSLLANPPGPVGKPTVRVAYVVPSNRTPQRRAVFKLQKAMLMFQSWYREQMERNGFGPKTFAMETGEDSVTPQVHVVSVPETDAYLGADVWGRAMNAASSVGVPLWATNQLWFMVSECHVQNADGSFTGGMAGGTGGGSGSDGGVGMLGSDGLARFDFLTDDSPYGGLILAALGPYPLVQDRSFPWFEGNTLSSVASSILGAALHEFSHGLGLPHTARNDENFHGNLLGNGLRGIRGYFHPDRYPNDYTRLSYPSAIALNVSRYFNADATFTDNTRPVLSVLTTGAAPLTNGQLQIAFYASDAGGLAAATLGDEGGIIESMPLNGTSTHGAFQTPVFTPAQSNHFFLFVYDRQGNRQQAETFIVPASGTNRAPVPFLKIHPPTPAAGEPVTLSAENSTDPDHSQSLLQVEWDIDGDGRFDTAPTTAKTLTTNLPATGVRLIQARLTDPAGAAALAVPVGLRVILSDPTAPTLAVTPPVDPAYTLTNTAVLSGSASDASGVLWVTVNDQLVATTDAFAHWSCRLGLLDIGNNSVTIVACDQAAPPNLHTNLHRIVYAAGEFDGDADGLPDAWELSCFGAVDAPDGGANDDPDRDGLANAQEYHSGTDPRNAASVLRVEALIGSGSELRLRFRTVTGKHYCIEGKSALTPDTWTVLVTNLAGDGSVIDWVDPMTATAAQRFYRLRLAR